MTARRILVLGASGGTGRHVVAMARHQGHDVTAFVRSAERMGDAAEGVKVITGSVTDDGAALEAAMRGQDVVISTLGVGNSLRSGGLIARSVPAILEAMEVQGIRRLVFTSAYGVGDTVRDVPLVPRLFMRTLLRDLYADKAAGEARLRRSDLDWTLVYPVTLTNGPATGRWRAGERLALSGFPKIPRADVASFLLTQVDDRAYLRTGVLVSSGAAPHTPRT
jgi:putative NADH-flavin reductase